ncbi:MAG: hypothetical protein R3293_17970 [Candidatus Promineifilaceae bacterium]|nr:hypothetical protein [Candidatus Promineifilaceae bacterium]
MTNSEPTRIRMIVIITLIALGLLLVGLAFVADFVGLDLTPGFGMIQMVALLAGLSLLTLASFLYLYSLRPKDAPHSLQADIGVRLGATGLVFTYVTGFSDLIGIGTHVNPNFARPFVGPLQIGGILLGVIMIFAGLVLYFTSRGPRQSSSLEFLLNRLGQNSTAKQEQSNEGG